MLFLTRILTVVLVLVGPLLLARWEMIGQRNFRVVEPGVLYRSGQMDTLGLSRTVHDYGIRTIISLRESGDTGGRLAQKEEEWAHKAGVNHISLPVRAWYASADETEAPALENVRQLLAILRDKRNHPVLLHCYAGIHRTGIYVAVCRMERDGWDLDRAMHEMRSCGYSEIEQHDDVMGFLTGYRVRGVSVPK